MKTLIALFSLLLTSAAFSGDRDTAYNLICKPLPFESERNQCVNLIRSFNYFNDEALEMCAKFPFTNTKFECLGHIGNKEYAAYEIDLCQGIVFDSKKLECLRDNGSTYGGGSACLPKREVLQQLRSAQMELSNGQVGTVDKRLTYLIGKFSQPSCQ